MKDEQIDSFIRKNIGGIDECYPSDAFVNNVMSCCYEYETLRATRKLRLRRLSLVAIPIFLILISIFVPGVSIFLMSMFSKITLIGLLKYYTVGAIIILTSFYLLLTGKMINFVRLKAV